MRNIVTIGCACCLAALALGACGGGGNAAGSAQPDPAPPPPPPQPRPPVGNTLPGPRPVAEPRDFVNFESGPVRPVALSADGERLYVVNTPDNRLEIFTVDAGLTLLASVAVGLEPVAVAEDPAGRAWVVNHLSDSVSVVDARAPVPHVVQTLWTGDEPRDIVFAGAARERAFVTTAHRGQNSPVDPAFNTPGVGRADVWVFDSTAIGTEPGGAPLEILTLFGDRPRPLAVSADGTRVWAGIFLSGNRTTVIAPQNITKSAPTTSADGVEQPDSGLILRFDGSNWVDDSGRNFSSSVPFSLPDYDLFEIDAITLQEMRRVSGVGTILFNIAVNPVSGTLYVSNLESRNHVRFAGDRSRGGSSIRGRAADQQITVVEANNVQPRLLNNHLDFENPEAPAAARELSLSTPLGLAVSGDGESLYVAAFGSGKLAMYETAALEAGDVPPVAADQLLLSGGGPSGVVLDELRNRAYVATRFDNGLSIVDLETFTEIDHLQLHNPEPAAVIEGRRFLYDARITSGNGNDSCASCHVFGDTDGLAWDLGDPTASTQPIPNVFIPISPAAGALRFHPLKGPMATQSMRGLRGHGPMHWRGDRTGNQRDGDETLEEAAFKEFNDAFDAFAALGRELEAADMQAFTDFAMTLTYPPNPVRPLDNSLTGVAVRGETLFNAGVVRVQTGVREVCVQCHTLDPARGLFGTAGLMADNSQRGERNFKIPHFRDQYQKVGMFGWGFETAPATGPQVRGFSFNHNGATSSNFIIADLGMPAEDLAALRAFLYQFPTESPAVTGQQVTVSVTNRDAAMPRVELLAARGQVTEPIPECDLVAHGYLGGAVRGFHMQRDGRFDSDSTAEPQRSLSELLSLVAGPADRLTFLCTPWGSGTRIGIDRDNDGIRDGDET